MITKVMDFVIGKNYKIKKDALSFYAGEIVTINWFSKLKTIVDKEGISKRQISCFVISKGVNINTIIDNLEHLTNEDYVQEITGPKALSNLDLIRLVKTKDKEATKEFIRRFKKMPKFNNV